MRTMAPPSWSTDHKPCTGPDISHVVSHLTQQQSHEVTVNNILIPFYIQVSKLKVSCSRLHNKSKTKARNQFQLVYQVYYYYYSIL